MSPVPRSVATRVAVPVVLACFAGGGVAQLQQAPQKTQIESTQEGSEFLPPLFGYRLKVTDTLLAAFTFLLFSATAALFFATRKLVKGAEKTAERQLRAYVHVDAAQAFRDDRAVLWARVKVRNYGQTPAYDVVQWIAIFGINEGDTPNFTRPGGDFKMAKGIIGPGGGTEFLIPTLDTPSPQQETALKAAKATIYVFGEIAYKDVFANLHRTKFRMFLSGEGATEGMFKNCEEGNQAT